MEWQQYDYANCALPSHMEVTISCDKFFYILYDKN